MFLARLIMSCEDIKFIIILKILPVYPKLHGGATGHYCFLLALDLFTMSALPPPPQDLPKTNQIVFMKKSVSTVIIIFHRPFKRMYFPFLSQVFSTLTIVNGTLAQILRTFSFLQDLYVHGY
jgi:hypothetical protein